jgi:exopolyphosphatase/pppGpp-phosphohydrolase
MRVAVLDLGSNTFHLVWTQVGRGGSITKLGSHKHVVRLGADVPRGGVIAEEHWLRAMDAVADLAARCPADCRRMAVATSVFREAANGKSFVDAVRARFGIPVEVLTGEEEAELAWLGVASGRPKGSPTAVVDGTPSMTREMTLPLAKIDLEELAAALARLDRYALIALGVPAGRADTIGLGASVMATIMDLVGCSTATVAEQGLREGVIVRALRDESARAFSPVVAAPSF